MVRVHIYNVFILLNLETLLWHGWRCYTHFTDGESEAQRLLHNLPKATEPNKVEVSLGSGQSGLIPITLL